MTQFKANNLRELEALMDRFPEDVPGPSGPGTHGDSPHIPASQRALLDQCPTAEEIIERMRARQARLAGVERMDHDAVEKRLRDVERYEQLRSELSRVEGDLSYAQGQLDRAERLIADAVTDAARAEYEEYAALCALAIERTHAGLEQLRESLRAFEETHDVEALLAARRRAQEEQLRRAAEARAARNEVAARRALRRAEVELGDRPADALSTLGGLDLEGVEERLMRQLFAVFTKAGSRAYDGASLARFQGERAAIVRPSEKGFEVLAELGLGEGRRSGSVIPEACCGRVRRLRG
jgi:hypothetical protein